MLKPRKASRDFLTWKVEQFMALQASPLQQNDCTLAFAAFCQVMLMLVDSWKMYNSTFLRSCKVFGGAQDILCL